MTDLKKIKSLFASIFLTALFLAIFAPVGYSGAAEPVELENLHKDLFFGGPVNPKIPTLLLNTEIPPQGADELFDGVYFSGNAIKVLNDEALIGIIHNEIRTYSGVSSWARGQLEAEINRGSWILLKPDVETVFSMEPERLWEDMQEKLKRKGFQLIEVKNTHSPQPRIRQDKK